MSELSEYFKDWKEHYRDVRGNAKEKRLEFLKNSNIDYEVLNISAGHVRITTNKSRYDVWLGTGKWTKLGSNKYNQSWMDLLKIIDSEGSR